ncbi:MAG: CBS domain-containing protein [Caldisericum sp.]
MNNDNEQNGGAFSGTAKEFIEVYNELTYTLRKELQLEEYVDFNRLVSDAIHRGMKIIAKNEVDLKIMNELRNSIAHNPFMDEIDPIAEPHPAMVEKLKSILEEIKHPPTALDYCIKADAIKYATPSDNLNDILKIMNENLFSWIPILETTQSGKVVIGVFSADVLFAYVSSGKMLPIDEGTSLAAFKDFIGIDAHPNEYFEFISLQTPFEDVQRMFRHSINDNKRLAVIFITQGGNPNEPILGMLTNWDVIK